MKTPALRRTPCARLAAFACILFCPAAEADEKKGKKQLAEQYLNEVVMKQIGLLVEYFEVDHTELPALLRQHQDEPHSDELRKRISEMVENKRARLVESSYLVTRSGQRAKLQAVREWIYPAEWDPAEMPQDLKGPIDRDAVIKSPACPTAMEMRPVGHTVEFDPVIHVDGRSIDLAIAPEIVHFMGEHTIGHGANELVQPIFQKQKAHVTIATTAGCHELFGVFTPATAHDRSGAGKRVLGFVRADVHYALSKADIEAIRANPENHVAAEIQRNTGTDPAKDPFATPAQARSEDTRRRQVSTVVEFIETDVRAAHAVIDSLGDGSDATAQRRRLDELIRKGKARVIETSYSLTRSGQRTKAESVREWIYPTETGVTDMPQDLSGPIGKDVDLILPPCPSAFDMRPIGATVEIDPVIGVDGKTIEVNISPELVRLIGERTYGKGVASKKQPLFETLQASTSATIPSGSALLLGMGSFESARAHRAAKKEERDAAANRRVLIFVSSKVKRFE